MSLNTSLPATLSEQQAKAESYLDRFSQFTSYKHRARNPYLKWLNSNPPLSRTSMYRFFNYWYPVSRHQPQILLRIAASYPEWSDRALIMKNYLEEDGMRQENHDPHYVLLERLIVKLGGQLDVDPEAEALVAAFHRSIIAMTPAQATGHVAAIEHPALDISDYFQQITRLSGRSDLSATDPYLYLHVDVEPKHIIWSHGNALDWMEDKVKQNREGFTAEDVIGAYRSTMAFWDEFWQLAFTKLGYHGAV
jgi:hypothetical protein